MRAAPLPVQMTLETSTGNVPRPLGRSQNDLKIPGASMTLAGEKLTPCTFSEHLLRHLAY